MPKPKERNYFGGRPTQPPRRYAKKGAHGVPLVTGTANDALAALIHRLGGFDLVARALDLSPTNVSKWLDFKARPWTSGIPPAGQLMRLVEIARAAKVKTNVETLIQSAVDFERRSS